MRLLLAVIMRGNVGVNTRLKFGTVDDDVSSVISGT